jgi:hypothetical protein
MSIISRLNPSHWRAVRRFVSYIRTQYFNIDTEDRHLKVDADVDHVRKTLGKAYFTNSWELSYHYEGEILNMRRPVYIVDDYGWYQVHVRGFMDDDDFYLHAHLELEPTEYPDQHIEEVNYNESAGVDVIASILDDAGISYERVQDES